MGLNIGFSSRSYSSYDRLTRGSFATSCDKLPNPDPANYRIVKYKQIGRYLVVLVNYPDCTNYEGNKVLLYRNVDIQLLSQQRSLDPHFSQNKNFYSPMARFEPTDEGWQFAVEFAKSKSS
jgi:hypothetical protein